MAQLRLRLLRQECVEKDVLMWGTSEPFTTPWRKNGATGGPVACMPSAHWRVTTKIKPNRMNVRVDSGQHVVGGKAEERL